MLNKVNEKLILYILFMVGAIAYISLIFNNNLWMDEAFSSVLVHTDFQTMLQRSMSDTLPPLYNVLNWCFTQVFGYNPITLRLSSILPMICVLFLGITVLYSRFGFRVSSIFTICLMGMPSMLHYGVEIRMYALGLFFVTASGIFALECFYNPTITNFCLLTILIVGSGYTHHFAFVSSGIIWFLLFLSFCICNRKYLKHVIISLVCIGILYIPCLFGTISQIGKVSGYFSMPDFSLAVLITCLKTPFITDFTPASLILLVCFIVSPILLIIQTKKFYSLIPGILCISVFIITLTFGAIVTILFKANIFTPRYLFPSYGLLWLGFSLFLSEIRLPKAIIISIYSFLLIVGIITYYHQFISDYRPSVNEMITFFSDNIDLENDKYIIFENDYEIEICFRYYFPEFNKTSWDKAEDCTGNIWYIEVPGFQEKLGTIESNNYSKEYCGDFNFDKYFFSLYKLTKTN